MCSRNLENIKLNKPPFPVCNNVRFQPGDMESFHYCCSIPVGYEISVFFPYSEQSITVFLKKVFPLILKHGWSRKNRKA
jgi:hypothetical protein